MFTILIGFDDKDEWEAHEVTLNPSSIGVSSSPTLLLENEVVDISTFSPPSRNSSSSSLQTVSSLADEWTRIEDETSRRRNLTGSSCASNSSSEHSNVSLIFSLIFPIPNINHFNCWMAKFRMCFRWRTNCALCLLAYAESRRFG